MPLLLQLLSSSGQVCRQAGVWSLRMGVVGLALAQLPRTDYLRPSSELGGAQQVMGKPQGPRWPPAVGSPAAASPCAALLILPSFSRVCVSFLLHAMAVVPRADETILGAAPGSPFPGNFLGTQMTSSVHFPEAPGLLESLLGFCEL